MRVLSKGQSYGRWSGLRTRTLCRLDRPKDCLSSVDLLSMSKAFATLGTGRYRLCLTLCGLDSYPRGKSLVRPVGVRPMTTRRIKNISLHIGPFLDLWFDGPWRVSPAYVIVGTVGLSRHDSPQLIECDRGVSCDF